jgi:hypothetical protein
MELVEELGGIVQDAIGELDEASLGEPIASGKCAMLLIMI